MDKAKKKRVRKVISWTAMAAVVALLAAMPLIAQQRLEQVRERLGRQEVSLEWEPGVACFLAKKAMDRPGGARALRPLIAQLLETPAADLILTGRLQSRSLTLALHNGRLSLTPSA